MEKIEFTKEEAAVLLAAAKVAVLFVGEQMAFNKRCYVKEDPQHRKFIGKLDPLFRRLQGLAEGAA